VATSHKKTAAAIAIMTAIFAVIGMTIFHLSLPIGCAVAVIGILIGRGVARGKFSRTPDATKRD
jgi:hypothetical protein